MFHVSCGNEKVKRFNGLIFFCSGFFPSLFGNGLIKQYQCKDKDLELRPVSSTEWKERVSFCFHRFAHRLVFYEPVALGIRLHITISWWVFLLAGLAALFVAFATVSYQTIQAGSPTPLGI